ncbi:4-(cytidine 5'-diphospho)-2-C-methyl-D-erythritol kinase, partial [bacterium]|nr:4-(cytidine 5'-diphospho)-2-C-methyl-D-erythritol kinase [bacterium]
VIKKYPEIKKAKDVLIGLGAVSSMMTGSGSTVFGIFENCGQRDKAAEELKKRSWKFFSVNNIN